MPSDGAYELGRELAVLCEMWDQRASWGFGECEVEWDQRLSWGWGECDAALDVVEARLSAGCSKPGEGCEW